MILVLVRLAGLEVVDGHFAYGTPEREDFDRLIPLRNQCFFLYSKLGFIGI